MHRVLAAILSRRIRTAAPTALALVMVGAIVALAVDPPLPPVPPAGNAPQFEFDGNILSSSNLDWGQGTGGTAVITATRNTTAGSPTFGQCTQTNLPATAGSP